MARRGASRWRRRSCAAAERLEERRRLVDLDPHRALVALITDLPFVPELELVPQEAARLADTLLRDVALGLDRRGPGRHQLAEHHAVDVRAVADPARVVAQAED